MPDDLYSFFMIDCAFGYKASPNFIRLDQIPNGKLRRGVEERILKHYKYYMRKVGAMSGLIDHSAHLISKDDGTWSEESIANAAFESPLPDIYPDSEEGQLTPRLRRCLKYESSDSLYVNIDDLSDREIFNSSTPPIDELTILYISDSENIPPSDDEEISCAQKPKFEQENSPVINRKKLRPPSFLENAPIAKRCINFGEELSLN